MIDKNSEAAAMRDTRSVDQEACFDFAAPLGQVTIGRLLFASGASSVWIDDNAAREELYSARFERHVPSVHAQEGTISIRYRRSLLSDWLSNQQEPVAKISLNRTVSWELEFRNGVSRLTADLRNLHLAALDLASVSSAQLNLPVPDGVANIYLSGSASDLTLQRPAGVALRLQIAGSASQLSLDGQRLRAMSGGIRWQTQDYNEASNRYEIGIAGSVSNLTIRVQEVSSGFLT